MRHTSFRATVLAFLLLLAGCASVPAPDPRDPFEGFNRRVDSVNRGVDQAALKPAAKGYERALPGLVRAGVSNFFANLGVPWSAVNSLAQLKVADAARNTMRFAVNTLFGLGGLLDIASDAGIEHHKEDFGSTLARWGVPSGPYLVLPLLGPSTLRDAAALPLDLLGDPLRPVSPPADRNLLAGTRAVDARARMLSMDPALDSAIDPYSFMRDAYLQHRRVLTGDAVERNDDGALEDDPERTADRALP